MVAMNAAIAGKLSGLGSNILKGHFIFNREMDETALKRQFGQVAKFPRGLNLAFSTDESDLEQYFNVRKQGYREVMGLKNYDGRRDAIDDISEILIVKSGTTVVGGARLTVSSPEKRINLPMEFDSFKVANIYPQIDLSDLTYCEMSRLALLPEFRTGEVMEQVAKMMLNYCLDNNIELGFAIATPIHARRFQRIFNHLGYGYVINNDIVVRKQVLEYSDTLFAAADFTRNQQYIRTLDREQGIEDIVFVEGERELAIA